MDPRFDPPPDPPGETTICKMCRQTVPIYQARTISGRTLCLGCLALWYGEDDDEDAPVT